MNRSALIEEIKLLKDYVSRNYTALADQELIIDSAVFTDPVRHQAETELLYRHTPLCVGPSCLLREPGDYFTFDDTGVPLLLIRGADGVVRGFLNMCSHRNAPVATGSGTARGGRLSCTYHAWSYDLQGQLRGIAYQQQGFPSCTDKSTMGLKPVPTAEKNGLIFVMANTEGSFDVDAAEAGIGADLMEFGLKTSYLYDTARMVVKQNYKSLLEAYHDFYHFQALHPNSIATLAYSNVSSYTQFGRNHRLGAPQLNIGDTDGVAESEWQPRKHVSFVYYCFPATVFFIVEDHFQVWRIYPLDQQTTVVYQSMYRPSLPSTAGEEQAAREYFNMINKVVIDEDYWMGELIQRGLNSGIKRNFILGRNEIGVQNMHQQIAEHMRVGGQGAGLRKVGNHTATSIFPSTTRTG